MKLLKSILPILAATVFSAGIASATFYKWSQSANSNSNADSTINWAEGQSPSSVNDSARAMMAASAKFRDDTSGKLVTGGTSTALTLTSNQVFSSLALMDGAEVAFKMSVTSGAAPTLNVDTLGAKALNQATSVAIPTGALVSGAIYRATYFNATTEWIVHGITGTVPSGTSMLTATSACPTGWTIGSTHNDKALRLVSGTGGGSGGSSAFSTVFGQTATGGTSLVQGHLPSSLLSVASIAVGDHSHSFSAVLGIAGTTGLNGGGNNIPQGATTGTTSSASTSSSPVTLSGNVPLGGSDAPHTHPITLGVTYVDVILCTKN